MTSKTVSRGLIAGLFAAALVCVAVPAFAQMGTLKGRVVDEAGKPVAGADVTFDYAGELNLHFTGKTDNKGEFIRAGLMAVGGRWTVTAKKGDMTGVASNVEVPLSSTGVVPDIVIRKGGAVSEKEAGDAAKARAALQKLYADVNTAMTAGSYDDAITKLNEYIGQHADCAACYVRLGDAYNKKGDAANAEQAYLKATSFDEKSKDAADAFSALATMYNSQRKFDEASKMTQKAMDAQAAGGGAVDPTAAFNAGVIFWNQNKFPEAAAQFQKATELKPDMADAYYYLGMCQVNQNKMDEAKVNLQKYMQLAPNGANAALVKSILDTMN
jgi:Tfp pilus assembly protein PilF